MNGVLKSSRLSWAIHAWRSEKIIGQVTETSTKRSRRLPGQKRNYGVDKGLEELGIKNGVEMAKAKNRRRQVVVAVRGLNGLENVIDR